MAKLPTASQLERPIPQPRQQVYGYKPRDGEGLEAFGKQLGVAGEDLQAQQDKMDVSYATADYLQRRVSAAEKATQGDDPTKYVSEYQAIMASEQKQSASMVRSARKRAEAEAAFALDTAQSLSSIQSKSESRSKDIISARLFEQGGKSSELFQSTTDPVARKQIKENYKTILDASKHVIGEEGAVKEFAKWNEDNAKITWATRTDEEKVDIINRSKGGAVTGGTPADTPGMVSAGNIDLTKRPVVKNADGSISTVLSTSFEVDGKEVLASRVSDDGKIMSEDEARDNYLKTGKNLGVFDTPDAATAYAKKLHEQQAGMYAPIKNYGADTVKPYSADRIAKIKALVEKPSEYDALIEEAQSAFPNIPAGELKLRAVVESGLNPSAQGPETPYGQSGGLMQLETGTAKNLGVTDRNDPRQSIFAAAKLLSDYYEKTGGDQTKVDKLYYAGSEKNMGKNTEQYAENLRAVRGGAGGASGGGGFAKTGYEFDDLPLKDKVESLAKARANIKGKIFEIVNDPEVDASNKKLRIDTLELQGSIDTATAAQARRVIKSQDAIDTMTNTPVMADIVTRIYDLNAIQETDSAGYLTGVQNIREEIMLKQAEAQITASDAMKLNNQLKTLASAKVSDATQRVGMEFYESQQKFQILPPEYRGRATRELFYKTTGKDNITKEAYNIYAQDIVTTINHERRGNTLRRIDAVNMPDADFLSTNNITMDQVAQAAKNKNLTEAEVIRLLKAKVANK